MCLQACSQVLDGEGLHRMLRGVRWPRSAVGIVAICALAFAIDGCSSAAPGDIVPPFTAGGSPAADHSAGGASGHFGDGAAGLRIDDDSSPGEGCIPSTCQACEACDAGTCEDRGPNGCRESGTGGIDASADAFDAEQDAADAANDLGGRTSCPAMVEVPRGDICRTGACDHPPSCDHLDPICGPCGNEDCCTSLIVPAGEFRRFHDPAYHASVSRFALDEYEVTVGRFRRFTFSYGNISSLEPGAGAHPRIPQDTGWNGEWLGQLPLPGDLGYCVDKIDSTWTSSSGASEALPMNCINWYVAFAFCAWDGGRLPTQTEWAHAAMGGAEERAYPWSVPPSSTIIDDRYANYACKERNACDVFPRLAYAGDKPFGAGRWGHFELSGNAAEWNLDFFSSLQPGDCIDCARLTPQAAYEQVRVISGGDYQSLSDNLRTDRPIKGAPSQTPSPTVGFRCARDLAP